MTPDVDLVRGTHIPLGKRPLHIHKGELVANHYMLKREPYRNYHFRADLEYETIDVQSDFNVEILRFLPKKRDEFC